MPRLTAKSLKLLFFSLVNMLPTNSLFFWTIHYFSSRKKLLVLAKVWRSLCRLLTPHNWTLKDSNFIARATLSFFPELVFCCVAEVMTDVWWMLQGRACSRGPLAALVCAVSSRSHMMVVLLGKRQWEINTRFIRGSISLQIKPCLRVFLFPLAPSIRKSPHRQAWVWAGNRHVWVWTCYQHSEQCRGLPWHWHCLPLDSLFQSQSWLAVNRQRVNVSAQGQGRSLSNTLFLSQTGLLRKELPRLVGFSPISPVNNGWGSLTAWCDCCDDAAQDWGSGRMLLGIQSCSGTSSLNIALPSTPDLWTADDFWAGEEDTAIPSGLPGSQQPLGRDRRGLWYLVSDRFEHENIFGRRAIHIAPS